MDKELVCIACPRGCRLNVSFLNDVISEESLIVKGNACPKGKDYGFQEVLQPKRMLTTTVKTADSDNPRLPVRLSVEIPKDRIFDCMKIINTIVLKKGCMPGDVILENIIEEGVNLIASGDFAYEER